MGWWDIGAGVAGAMAGQGMGMIFGKANDDRQLKQQGRLNKQAMEQQKEMAEFNQNMSLDMWEKTGYGAQKKQMQEAGINPALMYGGTGSGGTTMGSGMAMGAESGKAADAASTQGTNGAMGMQMAQMALLGAQKENIEADTRNKEAGAGKATAETGAVAATVANTEANTKLTDVKTRIGEIEASVAGQTQKEQIRAIVAGAEKMEAEAGISGNNQAISDITMKEQRVKIQQEAIGAVLRNAATKTGIALDQAKIGEITQKLMQGWEGLKIGKEGLQVARDNMEELTEAMLWGAGIQAGGNIVKGVMDIATKGKGSLVETDRIDVHGRSSSSRTVTTPIR